MSATKWVARMDRGYVRSTWYRAHRAARELAWGSWDGERHRVSRPDVADVLADVLADPYVRARTAAGRCRVCGTVAPLRRPGAATCCPACDGRRYIIRTDSGGSYPCHHCRRSTND